MFFSIYFFWRRWENKKKWNQQYLIYISFSELLCLSLLFLRLRSIARPFWVKLRFILLIRTFVNVKNKWTNKFPEDEKIMFCTENVTSFIRCTQSKHKVKKPFFHFHSPFGREFQGGQEYVCLGFSQTFFPVEKLKKTRKVWKTENLATFHRFLFFF